MEHSLPTRILLFYDGLMDWIGANLGTVWPILAVVMVLLFLFAIKSEA